MSSFLRLNLALFLLVSTVVCGHPTAEAAAFNPGKLQEIDAAVEEAIGGNRLPGGVIWIERHGEVYTKAYGRRAIEPEPEPMTEDTIFDAASLTKVVATTSAVLLLAERGLLKLDEPVQTYIPDFHGHGKEDITVRQLMTHTSGLRPGIGTSLPWSGYEAAIELACAEKIQSPPDTNFTYSDIGFIVLGEVVQRVSGRKLDEFAWTELFEPLQMRDSGFRPDGAEKLRIAPTERAGEEMLRGVVHDPTARRMGGVAGHAGLFTTAGDLARFARMLLNEGSLDGVRVFRPETVRLMRGVQTPEKVPIRRGLGWDIDSPFSRPRGDLFPVGSYGHTGWTGTSLWIDPFSKTFVIFLSNRNHPDGKGNVLALRARLATLAAEAVRGFDFSNVPGALPREKPAAERRTIETRVVMNGIDALKTQHFLAIKGLRVGLVTNHTGRDREGNHIIDLLMEEPEVELVALFAPEHGIRGELDAEVSDTVDEKTGLPVYSLYGQRPRRQADEAMADFDWRVLQSRKPKQEYLEGLDALIFDIQDIGCRFYTYISTMGVSMEAAAEAGIRFIVLDRVNPINGVQIDGPVLDEPINFVRFHNIPLRHGMTVGELARLFNEEKSYNVNLTVIPLSNWAREFWLDQTGLPWVNPSPNMRSLTQATLYPGVGLIEFTHVSVGRGTDTPFEVVGAPYIDGLRLAAELNHAGLEGVRFVPIRFTPRASRFKDELCGGVNILLLDRERCQVVDIGIALAQVLHRLYPEEFGVDRMGRLLGHPATLEAIKAGKSREEIRQSWTVAQDDFKRRRAEYLLYQ